MTFAWRDYLTLAAGVLQRHGEPGKRSAVSRAYYAAFNLARRYVGRTHPGVLPGGAADHDIVWRELERGTEQEAEIAPKGQRLRRERGGADYDIVWPKRGSVAANTTKAIGEANWVVRALEALESPEE